MASVVIFERNGYVVEWNKQGPYTMTNRNGRRREYPTKEKAIRAAKRASAIPKPQKGA